MKASLHADDLRLAIECAQGDPHALRRFEEGVLAGMASHVAHIDGSSAFVAEVQQEVRQRLLVARGSKPPRIAEYRGQGPLGAWVRAIAVRAAIDLRRRNRSVALEAEQVSLAETDPELDYLAATYSREFRAELEAVIEALAPEERDVLRMYYLERRSLQAIGDELGVHYATIARRLDRIRKHVLGAMRAQLRDRLELDDDDVEELLAFARERVNVSLGRILKKTK